MPNLIPTSLARGTKGGVDLDDPPDVRVQISPMALSNAELSPVVVSGSGVEVDEDGTALNALNEVIE
jgi:hypothetical protein